MYPGNPGGMHHHGGPPTSLAGGPPPPPPGHVTNSAPPPSGHGAGGVYGGMPYRPQYPLLPVCSSVGSAVPLLVHGSEMFHYYKLLCRCMLFSFSVRVKII